VPPPKLAIICLIAFSSPNDISFKIGDVLILGNVLA